MTATRDAEPLAVEAWRNRIVAYGDELVAGIVKNPGNWRSHPRQQQESLVGVLDEVGWVKNVIINSTTGHLVDGHLRVLLAERHGEQTVPVTFVELSEDEERLILASLDPIAALATIATDKLDELLRSIETDNPTVRAMLASLAKSSGLAIETLMPQVPEDPGPQIDRADELRDQWGTELGQLWLIPSLAVPGKAHRLLCGDSTSAEDVARLMAGERAALFATDPPYAVAYDGTNHPTNAQSRPSKNKDWSDSYRDWDKLGAGAAQALYDGFCQVARDVAIADDAAWYCWHASVNVRLVFGAWEKAGAFVHQQIIWVKSRPILGRSWYMWQHEPCLFGWVAPHKPKRTADDSPRTVWEIESFSQQEKPEHPTPKPLDVFAIPMRQHTEPGDICYEPFSGSGSQQVAGEQLGRLVYGLELEPRYMAVILERLAGLGLTPRLEMESHHGRPPE